MREREGREIKREREGERKRERERKREQTDIAVKAFSINGRLLITYIQSFIENTTVKGSNHFS